MNELFDADLADRTLTRVTHGYQGPDEASEHAHTPVVAGEDPYKEQPGDGALSPSFSTDGDILAFSSTASNLVFGDGNAPPLGLRPAGSVDGSDAFVVSTACSSPRCPRRRKCRARRRAQRSCPHGSWVSRRDRCPMGACSYTYRRP